MYSNFISSICVNKPYHWKMKYTQQKKKKSKGIMQNTIYSNRMVENYPVVSFDMLS